MSPPRSAPPPPPPSYGQRPQYGQHEIGAPMQFTTSATWSTGIFGCLSDVLNSCGVHGALYLLICLGTGCGCLYSCIYRGKMTQQYMLPKSPCNDCCLHCFCEACALCQEYRELKNRGFDMDLGWQGNMQRQNQGIVMPPMAPGGMIR